MRLALRKNHAAISCGPRHSLNCDCIPARSVSRSIYSPSGFVASAEPVTQICELRSNRRAFEVTDQSLLICDKMSILIHHGRNVDPYTTDNERTLLRKFTPMFQNYSNRLEQFSSDEARLKFHQRARIEKVNLLEKYSMLLLSSAGFG